MAPRRRTAYDARMQGSADQPARSDHPEPTGAGDPRPVLAALANPHARRMYARIVLDQDPAGTGPSTSKQRNALAMLQRAGLVRADGATYRETSEVLSGLLAAAAARRPQAEGPERFLDGRGRIDRYPLKAPQRLSLLQYVAGRVLQPGEVLTEWQLNERLAVFSADTATLRRYLVEAELLERTRSGSEYALVTD